MRSAAPAGISLLNYLRKRGLARLEPSWSAPLFFWRFSGISKIVCISLYRRGHLQSEFARPFGGAGLVSSWILGRDDLQETAAPGAPCLSMRSAAAAGEMLVH